MKWIARGVIAHCTGWRRSSIYENPLCFSIMLVPLSLIIRYLIFDLPHYATEGFGLPSTIHHPHQSGCTCSKHDRGRLPFTSPFLADNYRLFPGTVITISASKIMSDVHFKLPALRNHCSKNIDNVMK